MAHRILIVGGGFGGVTAAKHLSKKNLGDSEITLLSDRPWLEYYGELYRLIRHPGSIGSTCIPLRAMVPSQKVAIEIDTVVSIDAAKKSVKGNKKTYSYDTLILAPGSVPAYFGIPGMEEHSITMKSIAEAHEIGRIAEERIQQMTDAKDTASRKILGRFLIVGGGPTGIEIAGELLPLMRTLADARGIDSSDISVEIIEAMDRLFGAAEPKASEKILKRLTSLGVKVHLKTAVASAQKGAITLKDGTQIEAGTLIWTAGVQAHPLLKTIEGLELDKRGRAVVDEQLRAKGHPEIFVLGDCASTQYSGMAQTAVEDGTFAPAIVAGVLKGRSNLPKYIAKPIAYAVPAGPLWAAVKYGPLRVYGFLGHAMRRAADLHVYMLMLPWKSVPAAYLGKIDLNRYGIMKDAVVRHQS